MEHGQVEKTYPAEVVDRATAAQASLVPLLEQLRQVHFPVVTDGPEPQDSWHWISRGGSQR